MAPGWFLFGLQRDGLAQERAAQWWELANLNKTKNRGSRFARDDKETGPSWGEQLPGERPRETAET
jgi:hypothetical protein